ncbi:cullin 1, putative [Trypanosoma brucei gambiense DAL972]|uniref:Cullin 1, putative n=2 Tax=Trypanosoma brucei TaxID=5691 RepID=D0A911_TRYB9|nr:cullin 1, putative [Trypanosoma brucei gambiense DAL972]RHW67972.1 cullin 1 [Trypanosoma brucei equiperdum]CBH18162.1 cullin 1, putative [Trypanosoma brucei gambiense DAL972]|eukprot:XP_011780426.1 cullin 1, putative [Trypanosoma brucei gambiense DAL972]
MEQTNHDDVSSAEVARAYSGSLGASSFQFTPLWESVDYVCSIILSWYDFPDFKGGEALQQLVRAYTIVCRLVSSPCTGCPPLARPSVERDIVTAAEVTQSLVVYSRICDMIRKRLDTVVGMRFRDAAEQPPPRLLEDYIVEWKRFITSVNMLKFVFSYLHGPWQKYGVPPGLMQSTEVIALNKWSEMLMNTNFQEALTNQIFELVAMDRHHHPNMERAQILREVGHALGVVSDARSNWYVTLVEERYLQQLTDFCKLKTEEMKLGDVEHYIEEALTIFRDETERAIRLLAQSSIQPVVQRIAEVLINDELSFLDEFISSEIVKNRVTQLRQLYSLLSQSQVGLRHLRDEFKKCVIEKGRREINEACERAKNSNTGVYQVALEKVISVYRDFQLPMKAFGDKGDFEKELIDGLHNVLTACSYLDPQNMLGREVARFAHNELISRKLGVRCEEDEGNMNNIVILFRVLPTKNLFVETYPMYLCSRLLSTEYVVENERLLIQEITQTGECTRDFMNKCATMLNDVGEVSERLSEQFRDKAGLTDLNFHPTVLNSYFWPNFLPEPEMAIPGYLQMKLLEFGKFFQDVCPRRHISYVNRLSQGVLRFNLSDASPVQGLDICVGVRHLPVAELFNCCAEWELQELIQSVGNDNSNSCLSAINDFAKHGILDIHEEGGVTLKSHLREVLPGCRVSIGRTPDIRNRKIVLHETKLDRETKVDGAGSSDFSPERYDVNTTTEQMVALSTQATLIRAFKSEGTASFSQLFERVENESPAHLKPSIQQMKVALEFLISREFVRRNEDGTDTFSYVT